MDSVKLVVEILGTIPRDSTPGVKDDERGNRSVELDHHYSHSLRISARKDGLLRMVLKPPEGGKTEFYYVDLAGGRAYWFYEGEFQELDGGDSKAVASALRRQGKLLALLRPGALERRKERLRTRLKWLSKDAGAYYKENVLPAIKTVFPEKPKEDKEKEKKK